MELKPGYKQTEVGVIPEDWEVAQLGSLNPFVTSGSRGWADFYADTGHLFVRITNLSRSSIYLDLSDCKFVDLPAGSSEGRRTELREHDLLISITADIGIIGYVDVDVPVPAYINQHIALVRFDANAACSQFLSYFLASGMPQSLFKANTDTGAKAGMSLKMVQQILVALPPLPEQKAIAKALSDMDSLLNGLDSLIAKKRDIKQATMQQLLTGKTRLPGFSGEWEVKRLGEVGRFRKGRGVTKDQARTGNIPCVRYGELYTHHHDVIKHIHSWISPEVAASAVRLFDGDILFAGSGETKQDIGKSAAFIGGFSAYAGGDIVILSPVSSNATYLGYYLNTVEIAAQKASCGQGDAVVHISSGALSSIICSLPPLPEQQAIAKVLTDMDAELEALEQRRDKTRELKQAMMQELLTGRTRLV